ncbi:hypothetical protein M427DRAFT_262506 [Gonapodya prolifera JEL478]|uniref:UPF3 domain-containing protein n=1 Tax=Gonapodya prolifera (strain JEL478) TaxID=1344416 RepID=A0A138ZWX6_GONPJ|nr:hypothetical protein M427DRAFT_262506 [Gonapodya prolifera JEL478]|eukprot:KXS08997.1 hypothetical protein M427DRAFT_262506 [Gonapodya prolifera JEL478]
MKTCDVCRGFGRSPTAGLMETSVERPPTTGPGVSSPSPGASGRSGKAGKQLRSKTKVVIRRLPPNLPEQVFWSSVEGWLPNVDWKVFVSGKLSSNVKLELKTRYGALNH